MTQAPGAPLVSVVIPCYNQARFLAASIESVRRQEPDPEILVVDDGSTDETGAVAASYDGVCRVRQENRGLAGARNRGLQEARGTLIVFLDADDVLLPGGIAAGIRALERRPECAMAYGRCLMMGPDGAHWPTPPLPVTRSDHHAAFLRSNLIWMPAAAIFRRDALDKVKGFASGFDAAADYDLYLRITRDALVHDHGGIVAAYRQHASSMSGSASRMLRETLAVMRRHRERATGQLAPAWADGVRNWQDFYGTRLVEEIRAHLRAGKTWPTLRKAATLGRLAPWVLRRELGRKASIVAAARRPA
jgi:glycosyltransferase involved in cell wall biosynthesis